VTLHTGMRRAAILVASASLTGSMFAVLAGNPADRDKDKKDKAKADASQMVDTGTFGVFIRGQRVASETFSVEQRNGTSIIKSQVKETSGADPVSQKSNLELTATGELLRYEWSQASGGSLTVMPNNDFLTEKITAANSTKPAEKPFLMPSTSSILDNNFFVQREVLLWRYLAADCKPDGGNFKCQSGPADFGALVPQDQISVHVQIELIGPDKITVHGAERELLRLRLKGEDFEWSLWVDPQEKFKLMRVAIPADNTEVIRD
jgi:hypothetical protein